MFGVFSLAFSLSCVTCTESERYLQTSDFRLRTSHFEVQTSDFVIVISGFSPSLVLAFSRTGHTRQRKSQGKNPNTMCVGHHSPLANANNVNKTWALLQTTGGRDEPNIVCIRNSQHGTQSVKTHNHLFKLVLIWLNTAVKFPSILINTL
jgi:hypothetical protein